MLLTYLKLPEHSRLLRRHHRIIKIKMANYTGSPVVTVSGGYRTYKYNSSGSITF